MTQPCHSQCRGLGIITPVGLFCNPGPFQSVARVGPFLLANRLPSYAGPPDSVPVNHSYGVPPPYSRSFHNTPSSFCIPPPVIHCIYLRSIFGVQATTHRGAISLHTYRINTIRSQSLSYVVQAGYPEDPAYLRGNCPSCLGGLEHTSLFYYTCLSTLSLIFS